jgi:hypothetical protein
MYCLSVAINDEAGDCLSGILYHYLRLCLGAITVRLRPVCAELKVFEPAFYKAEPNEYPHHHLPMYWPR